MNDISQEQQSWLKHMLEDHEELRSTVGSTRSFLENPRPDPGETGYRRWAAAMSQQLADLHDGLSRHFREEESEGIFHDLAQRYPRASDRVEKFQGQHERLLEDLRSIMGDVKEYSAGIASDDPRLRRRVADVLSQVDSHERGESELLQRMYYNDIGSGG